MAYLVTVKGVHEDDEHTFEAQAATVDEQGRVNIMTLTGSASYGPTSWGSVTIVRVPEITIVRVPER